MLGSLRGNCVPTGDAGDSGPCVGRCHLEQPRPQGCRGGRAFHNCKEMIQTNSTCISIYSENYLSIYLSIYIYIWLLLLLSRIVSVNLPSPFSMGLDPLDHSSGAGGFAPDHFWRKRLRDSARYCWKSFAQTWCNLEALPRFCFICLHTGIIDRPWVGGEELDGDKNARLARLV